MAVLYLNKSHFFDNLNKISSINSNILAVIKDNAYGHGIIAISKLLVEYGIKKVCVRDNKEAEVVKDFFEEILIFNPSYGYSYKNFSYTINSFDQLKKTKHKNIHLKIDTGMHRNGILFDDLEKVLDFIKEKEFNLKGVFSHLCCADEITPDTFIQFDRFKKVKKFVEEYCNKNNLNIPYFHLSNSAGLKLPETFDYVRPGIAMYGGIDGFRGVAKLVAKTISKRELKKGEGVGYNKIFIADEDMIISTIDIGYGDGIPYFKNGIRLKESIALGKISMDSMIVKGDFKEVVIFDDVKEFVKNFDTITYDILVKLSPRIKRVVI